MLDIAVVGAGVSGLAAAALLATGPHAKQLRITLIDAAPRPDCGAAGDIELRVSAISAGSGDLLDALGAWPPVDATRLCPYDHMRVWDEADEHDSATALSFDAGEFAVAHLGYIVENLRLQLALLRVLDDTTTEFRFTSALASITPHGNGHSLALDNGVTVNADLVIAADGAHSRVRESMGIEVARHPYEQCAFVTHLRPARPHRSTAWQRFLREGPIGILPLADGRVSIVWSTTPANAEHARTCSDDELGHLITQVSGHVLGELVAAGPRGVFPLAAQHANTYVAHGIALIGDAAHTVHPLAGQGANLGLADAEELVKVIHAALERNEHPADRPVLRRYERARKGENAAMMHFMTGLNRLFASDSAVLAEIRKAGMALFNRSGPIRQRIVGVALGGSRR